MVQVTAAGLSETSTEKQLNMHLFVLLVVLSAELLVVGGQTCTECGKDCCNADELCASSLDGGTCYKREDRVLCNALYFCLKPTSCCGFNRCCPENTHCCGLFTCCPTGTTCYNTRFCIKNENNRTVSSTTLSPRTTRPATAYSSTTRPTSKTRPVTTRPTTKRPITKPSSRKFASSYDDDKPQVWYYIVAAIGGVLLVSVVITIICVKRRSMARQGNVIARSGAPSLPYGTPLAIQSASPTSGHPSTKYTKPQVNTGLNATTNRQSQVYVNPKLGSAGYKSPAVNKIYYTTASSRMDQY